MLGGAPESAWVEAWGGLPEGPGPWPSGQGTQRGWGARPDRYWFSPFS